MPNQWFRMYSEFADDPKVQILSEAMQRRIVMLFCLRCKGKQLETFHETEIAFHLRVSMEQLAETKAAFLAKGFIDERWNIVNWNQRQYVSDTSTERVRKYRQGLKQSETFQKRDETQNETAPEQNRTDTEQKKPSRKNRSFGDERHTLFKDSFFFAFRHKNRIDPPWDGQEAGRLGKWLKANPSISLEQWKAILNNRAKSPINQAESLSAWIGKALSWLDAPADSFGKPLGGSNGRQTSVERTQSAIDTTNRVLARLYSVGDDGAGPDSDSSGREPVRGAFDFDGQ